MLQSAGPSPVAFVGTQASIRAGGEQGPRAVFRIRLTGSSRAWAFLVPMLGKDPTL